MLFHDEISAILRDAAHNSVLCIDHDRYTVRKSAVDCDGIKVHGTRCYDAHGLEYWISDVTNRIYNAMRRGETVTIDGADIRSL